jgi:hypothetical protein
VLLGVEAAQHGHRPVQTLLAQPLGVQLGEAEGALAHARAETLHQPADAPAQAAEVVAPVGVAPDLEPIDLQAVTARPAQQGGRQQREVGKGADVQHLVAAPVAQQVRQHAEPEDERRQDATPPAGRVEGHPRSHGPHVHPWIEIELLAPLPLAQRQIGDLVPLRRQPLGEVSIPALAAADRVRVEAVVDDADSHGGSINGRIRHFPPARAL